MARITIDEFVGANVQLSRKNLSCNSQITDIRSLVTTRPKARARSDVSWSNTRLLRVLLLLLCLLHFAEGSSTRFTELFRVAAEHTIEAGGWKLSCHQVDRATESYHSCRNGVESCWSCLDLDTATLGASQPFFLQSTSSYGRSQASFGSDAVLSKFTLGEFRESLSNQFRKRRFGPMDGNHEAESQTKVFPGDGEAQHWILINIATVCIRDPTFWSVSSSKSFSAVKSDHNSLHWEAASWSWRCNSTLRTDLGAPMTTSDAGAFPTKDSTKLVSTFSSDWCTKTISFRKSRYIRTWTDSVLLQILEGIDDELLHADHESSCDNHGQRTTKMGRRMLISDSWKPVIVLDSVVVGIGFFLAVSALSCWVWQWRAIIKSDGDRHRQSMLPYSAVSPTADRRSPSPTRRPVSDTDSSGSRSRSRSGTESGRAVRSRSVDDGQGRLSSRGSGRWAQAKDGPGRWEELPEEEEVPLREGPGAANGDLVRESRAEPEGGPGRGSEAQEEVHGRRPRVTPEGQGGHSLANGEGPGRGPQAPEEGQNRERQAAEEEGQGRGSPMTGQASEDGTVGATVHRSSPSRYRAEAFCFRGLKAATGGFHEKNKLGEGSFGSVYRGRLFDGREVAIKRADRNNLEKALVNKQNSFRAELDVMSRLHHKHLVNLVGYCDDCGEMMLVYEYMPNGTLSDHLHNKRFQSRALFSWKVRIRVALQAARGIEYLHTYAEPPVIHRDIKSSNILLDAKGLVRVSDFGLCLIFPSSSGAEDGEEEEGRQHVTTNAAGTIGYMDPEYYCHRHLTTKSDVYSFGVVILELLTGRWAIHRRNNSEVTVVEYAVPAIEADDVASILDPRVQVVSRNEFAAVKVMAEVGSHAVRRRGKDRPSMTEIIRRLEHAVTLCRSRHAPIPVFGADIGSSTDPSLSPLSHSRPSSGPSTDRLGPPLYRSDPGPAAPAAPPSHESVKGVVREEEYDESPGSGTDVAQFGSVLPSCSQVHPILEEFFELQDIHPKGSHDHRDDDHEHFDIHPKGSHDRVDDDKQFDIHPKGSYDRVDDDKHLDIHPKCSYDRVNNTEHFDDHLNYPSEVVDIQVYNDSPWQPDSHEEILRQARSSTSRPDASASTIPVVDLSASAIPGCEGGLLSTSHGSSSWERVPERRETLRERWQRAASRRSTIKSGLESGENFIRSDRPFGDGALPRGGGSFYSCEGGDGGSAAASLLATEVPLDFYSVMVVDDPLLDRRTPVMAGFTNFSELGIPEDVNYPLRPPPQLFSQGKREIGSHGRRVLGHGEESSYGLVLAASQVCNGSLEWGEGSADDYNSDADVDIHEFADEYPDERAGSAAYAGFNNLSVLQDLDELMKALQTLKAEANGQEVLEKC